MAWRFVLCLGVAGHYVDLTRMLELESQGALCDASILPEVDCDNTLWQRLLELICRHCEGNRCLSHPELADVAHAVLRLYITMLEQGQENLETFSCKHGLLAALLFHSEHVALDFRRPSASVEVLRPPTEVTFNLSLEAVQSEPAVVEARLQAAQVPLALVDLSRLEVVDSEGFPVTVATDEHGVHTLESVGRQPTENGFPLRVSFAPATGREFLHIKRHMSLSHTENPHVVSIDVGVPVMSLSPFPFHTAKLRALRTIDQVEYDQFVADLSLRFAEAGVFHVLLDGDYTLRYWDTGARHWAEKDYLQSRYGLNRSTGEPLRRCSFFVPWEQRLHVSPLVPGAVELDQGHLQFGEQPYGFATALNFRALCSTGLWVSIYFYITEAVGSLAPTGPSMTVLPLAFWVPCRIPAAELFPVHRAPLGSGWVPRPARGAVLARRWASEEDPLHSAHSGNRGGIYHGSCRESLARQVGASVAPWASMPPLRVVRELLPMHDMSGFAQIGMESPLEVIMGFRQMHKAKGLELYQDKIQLTEDFRGRGLPVPRTFFSSYDADFELRPLLQRLERDGVAYVAKAAHLCCSLGVFAMDGGVDRLTGRRVAVEEVHWSLRRAFQEVFTEQMVDPRCGDWGTVQAGSKPGILVEELIRPSVPLHSLLQMTGAEDWIAPDSLACHLVWSTLFFCSWETKVRLASGEAKTEHLGLIFRDGACLSCKFPRPFRDWASTVWMLEGLLPHTDYVRISLFVREGAPIINEVEYTTGGLEVISVPIAREWNLQWLEGYYKFLS
ncbi:unnamed protein product [Effrenium voratum]|uniref:Uncharacterized protein n=1 Tax=Effrenium voratum TaxID=2562239 RepID=A0AA36HYQ2_9DINO|nr:unnamed protein product [Effrenium voratum]CAJ1421607.1 unnamed protein product [Effrenium voratum]